MDRTFVAAPGWRCCGPRSARRRAAAKRLGGTLNTAFLTAAAEAAGRYHDRDGAPVEELRAAWRSAPAPSVRRQRVLAGPHAGADRRDADRRAFRVRSRRQPARPRGVDSRRRRSTTLAAVAVDAADVARSPGSPASRRRRSTSRRRTCAARRSPLYVAGRRDARELPGRPARRRGLQPHVVELQPTASTWASTSTPRRSTEPELLQRLPGAGVRRLLAADRRMSGRPDVSAARTVALDRAGCVSSVRTSSSTSVTSPDDTSSRRIICARALSMTLKRLRDDCFVGVGHRSLSPRRCEPYRRP